MLHFASASMLAVRAVRGFGADRNCSDSRMQCLDQIEHKCRRLVHFIQRNLDSDSKINALYTQLPQNQNCICLIKSEYCN